MNADQLSLIEDAGLNASAPPQQRWLDGWLLRFSPGKAQRARSVNAVAAGRLPMQTKLTMAEAVYLEAELPMLVRITPFSQPPQLDAHLELQGWPRHDETLVMVCTDLGGLREPVWPQGVALHALSHTAMAHAVGALRGSTLAQQQAHAERLTQAPVAFAAWALRREADASVLAGGQTAREGELVGLYDVFTAEPARRRGLATALCTQLMITAREQGARTAYLQVSADNAPAIATYRKLGFTEGYRYHYRIRPVTNAPHTCAINP
jgi:ribosomal protein S18 acetylase RimI-like enzyme